MAMVDISLLYTRLTVHAGVPIANSSVSVWIDSELAVPLTGCEVNLEYIDSAAESDHALLTSESYKLPQALAPGAGLRLPLNTSGSDLGAYIPSQCMVGLSV